MKYLVSLLVVVFQTTLVLTAGTVTILPTSPKESQTVTIEYLPTAVDASIVAGSNVHAVVYGFTVDGEAPKAIEVPLKRSGERWVGTTTLDKGIVYSIVKVGNGLKYDTNRGLFWEIFTSSERGSAVYGAHMKAAFARYGGLPAPCKMKDDYQGSADELTEETKLHSKNLTARVNLLLVQKNLGQISEDEVNAKLRELTSGSIQAATALDAVALAQAFEQLGRPQDAQRVTSDALSRFPRSLIEEQSSLSALSQSPSIEVFVEKANEHLQKYPESFARQNLIDGVVRSSTQAGALRVLVGFLDRTPKISAMTYHQAVNFIGANDTLRPDAFRLINTGIAASEDDSRKPIYMGASEWKEEQRIAKGLLYFVQGAIQRAQGETTKAIASLERSIEITGAETDKNCFDMIVGLYRTANDQSKAIAMAERALSAGAGTQGIHDSYRALLAEKGLDSIAIAKKESALKDKGRSVLADRVAREMLNQSAVDGPLSTLDGKIIRVSDWKGKVVIIDYWATWCGPCRQSFPSLQKLYERYKGNPNVVFAIVNVWERTDDRVKTVKDFLAGNKTLTFPMYIDTDDSVVSKYGVTGIPTKFYLGKDGRIQFKEVGFTPEEQFLEEATNRIEALLAQ